MNHSCVEELHSALLFRWEAAVHEIRKLHEDLTTVNGLCQEYKDAAELFDSATEAIWRFKVAIGEARRTQREQSKTESYVAQGDTCNEPPRYEKV